MILLKLVNTLYSRNSNSNSSRFYLSLIALNKFAVVPEVINSYQSLSKTNLQQLYLHFPPDYGDWHSWTQWHKLCFQHQTSSRNRVIAFLHSCIWSKWLAPQLITESALPAVMPPNLLSTDFVSTFHTHLLCVSGGPKRDQDKRMLLRSNPISPYRKCVRENRFDRSSIQSPRVL